MQRKMSKNNLNTINFDTIIERRSTHSDKWNKYPKHVIPLWIADMDFEAPQCITQALKDRLSHGIYGYTSVAPELSKAIEQHLLKHYQWAIQSQDLIYLPGLVCALHASVRIFSQANDGIVVPGPVYHHLSKAAEFADRELITTHMELVNDRWVPDFVELERACSRSNSKMLLLCNPHNPGGTVYTKSELLQIHEIAQRYELIVVSDEIHCDLILDDVPHIPFASLNEDAKNRSITLMAPSKTYNIAGLGFAFCVIQNPTLRLQFKRGSAGLIPSPNLLGFTAALSAYTDGESWRRELLDYLRNNRQLIREKLAHTPLKLHSLEATYLEWIDVSALNLPNPHAFFLNAGVGFSDGKDFGNSQFLRLNFGCSKELLTEALDRILSAIQDLESNA